MPEQITNFTSTMWTGLSTGFARFMNFIPSLLGALVILVAGWYIAKFVGRMIERVLMVARLETVVEKAHIGSYLPRDRRGRSLHLSTVLGVMAKWFIFLVFVQAGANTLGVVQVTEIINRIILFIPHVVVATAILVFGAWAANFCSELVERSTAKLNLAGPNIPARLVKYGILGFSVIAAAHQLGIATNLINILFTGLVASLALAFGLAFGLGGKDAAADVTKGWISHGQNYSNLLRGKEGEETGRDVH